MVFLGYKVLEEIWKVDLDENRILELDFRFERFKVLLSFKIEINLGVMRFIICVFISFVVFVIYFYVMLKGCYVW